MNATYTSLICCHFTVVNELPDAEIDDEKTSLSNFVNKDLSLSWNDPSPLTAVANSSDMKDNIEGKEKFLADILNLNCLKMDHGDESHENQKENVSVGACKQCGQNCSDLEHKNLSFKDESGCHSSAALSYGPPSGSSNVPFSSRESFGMRPPIKSNALSFELNTTNSDSMPYKTLSEEPAPPEYLTGNWSKHFIPAEMNSLIGLNEGRFCFVDKSNIYFSSSVLSDNDRVIWARRTLPFKAIDLCSDLSIILVLESTGTLYSLAIDQLIHEPILSPKLLINDIYCVAVDRNFILTLNLCHTVSIMIKNFLFTYFLVYFNSNNEECIWNPLVLMVSRHL